MCEQRSTVSTPFAADPVPPPVTTPPPAQCARCKEKINGTKAKPAQLVVQYDCGAPPASVSVKKGLQSYDPATGIAIIGSRGSKLGGDVEFKDTGDKIHVSCSKPLGRLMMCPLKTLNPRSRRWRIGRT